MENVKYRGYGKLISDIILQAINNVRDFKDSHRLGKQGWEKLHGGNYMESLEWLYSKRGGTFMLEAGLNQEAVLEQLEKEGVVPTYVVRKRVSKGEKW